MGKPKNKKVGNPSTISKQPLSEKKKVKALKAAKKIAKEISNKVDAQDSKTVKTIAVKVDGRTPVDEQGVNNNEKFGGFIFMCNGRTKSDCFNYKVFGLPENKREFVFKIKPGMRLFLYDIDLKVLYGIFMASSCGGMLIEPAAFSGSYPAQVRFVVEHECIPVPHHIFRHAIKDNYTGVRNMFKTELSIGQVKELCKLFRPSPPQQPAINKDGPVPKPIQVLAPASAPIAMLWPGMAPVDVPAPLPIEMVRAPIRTMPLDPQFSNEYRNMGSNPNPFLMPHGNSPNVYIHPYRASGPPYETHPAYEIHPARAPSKLSGYSNGNSLPVSSRYSFAGPSMSYTRGHAS